MILYKMFCCEQDCVVVLAPYPINPNPVESFNVKTVFDLQGVWYARPHTHTSFIIIRKIKAGILRRGWVLCTRSGRRMWMQTRALCL
jgi:hypothetical protein